MCVVVVTLIFFKPDMRINDRLYKMRLELNLEKFHFANVP